MKVNQDLWNEFKESKLNVHCKTEEEAKEFIKYCYSQGIEWYNGTITLTNWNCGYKLCYGCDSDNNIIYWSVQSCKDCKEEIITYQDLFIEDNQLQDQQQEKSEWQKINDEITGEWIEDPEIDGYDICINQNNKERYLESVYFIKPDDEDCSFYFEGITISFNNAIEFYQWLGNNIKFALDNKPQPKKMSKQEIENALGYKIEII